MAIVSITAATFLAALKLCLQHAEEKARIGNSPKAPDALTSAGFEQAVLVHAAADWLRSSDGTNPNANFAAIIATVCHLAGSNGRNGAEQASIADQEILAAETLRERAAAEQAKRAPAPGPRSP